MKRMLPIGLAAIALSCSQPSSDQTQQLAPQLATGSWEAHINMQGQRLPFRFEVANTDAGKPVMYLLNDAERILIDQIETQGDSLRIGMHIFNTSLIVKPEGQTLKGRWTKNDYTDYSLPFEAVLNAHEEQQDATIPATDLSGKWEVTFKNPDTGEDEPAIGVFKQQGNKMAGTFLTPTGDYRYLEGAVAGNQLQLSCFDGEHAFLFRATISGSDVLEKGSFWSGRSWTQPWSAKRNEKATLPDPEKLTFLKDGHKQLAFTFPDLEGKNISLSDERFKGKVTVVQIMGSWCPNCMDETNFLSSYYQRNKDNGFEVVALAFERSSDFDKSKARLQKLQQRFGIEYPILIAGTNDKDEAAKKLPMLNHIMSFPTTIFIDRQGKVRKIHTGFSGPGTGTYYDRFVEDFDRFVQQMIAEKAL